MELNDIEEKALVEILINSLEYGGKVNPKSVLGRMMGKYPDLRPQAKNIMPAITKVMDAYLPIENEEARALLNDLAPDALSSREEVKMQQRQKTEERKSELSPLPEVDGQMVVRLAPDPSKYPHIGHALNYTVNKLYAEKYGGKIILRFDDTNPLKVAPEYYEAIKEGLEWAGVVWDLETKASDHMAEFYSSAESLISKGHFYICTCEHSVMRKNREEGVECQCRNRSIDQHLTDFAEMKAGNFDENSAIVRLVGDMKSQNPVMRDPVMFRILHAEHPLLDQEYHVWPTYDYESPYLDWKYGVTHIIRSGEFGTMREEQQSYVIKLLGGKAPHFFQYGRYNILGCPMKGRVIRELVEKGVVAGWDDIRLFTIRAWKRRGIQPEVIRELIRENGTTPKASTIDWSVVEKLNKRVLEPRAKRLFFVRDPVKVRISDAPVRELELPFHPKNNLGSRQMQVGAIIFIDREDSTALKEGDVVRLKDLYNIEVAKAGEILEARFAGEDLPSRNVRKIQWVPEDYVEGELLVPQLLEVGGKVNVDSLHTYGGYFEPAVRDFGMDEIAQLERIGFAKISYVGKKVVGNIIHK